MLIAGKTIQNIKRNDNDEIIENGLNSSKYAFYNSD